MIQCLECGKYLTIITESHCQNKHKISLIQYKMKHPGAPTVSEEIRDSWTHAQEERYNPGEAGRRHAEQQEEELRKAREYLQRIDPDGSKGHEAIKARVLGISPMHKLPEEEDDNGEDSPI